MTFDIDIPKEILYSFVTDVLWPKKSQGKYV